MEGNHFLFDMPLLTYAFHNGLSPLWINCDNRVTDVDDISRTINIQFALTIILYSCLPHCRWHRYGVPAGHCSNNYAVTPDDEFMWCRGSGGAGFDSINFALAGVAYRIWYGFEFGWAVITTTMLGISSVRLLVSKSLMALAMNLRCRSWLALETGSW